MMVSRSRAGFTLNIIDTPGLIEGGYINDMALDIIKRYVLNCLCLSCDALPVNMYMVSEMFFLVCLLFFFYLPLFFLFGVNMCLFE